MKSEETHIDFENALAPWLGKTSKLSDLFLQEYLKANNENLTKEQLIVLKRLHDNDGMNQNELAFITLRNKSSLTRLLANMEKGGCIYRKQSNEDKRINHVFLTDLGKATYKRIKPMFKNYIEIIEENISEEEKQFMITLLKKIQLNLNSKIAHI